MNTRRAIADEGQHTHLGKSVVTLVLGLLGSIALFIVLLFPMAGRLDWLVGWAYLGILFVYLLITWICLLRWNPVLIQRRMRIGAGTKRWDYVWAVAFTPLFCAIYLVAGLDAADGNATLPTWVWPIGLIIFCPGSVSALMVDGRQSLFRENGKDSDRTRPPCHRSWTLRLRSTPRLQRIQLLVDRDSTAVTVGTGVDPIHAGGRDARRSNCIGRSHTSGRVTRVLRLR